MTKLAREILFALERPRPAGAQAPKTFCYQIARTSDVPPLRLFVICLLLFPELTQALLLLDSRGWSSNVNQAARTPKKTAVGQRKIKDRLLDMQVSLITPLEIRESG